MDEIDLAPIVLFVYNRPWHTLQTLQALKNNNLSDKSILFVFADGEKNDATQQDKKNITEVREIIRRDHWCQTVIIRERKDNFGLANSIVEGVTEIVNKYGKVIVLVGDLITSEVFMQFLTDDLD